MKIVAFIPVRSGSKGIPGKNIKLIGGRPLVHWVELAAIGTKNIAKVVVATDSKEIASIAKEIDSPKLEIFLRDPSNCTDTATTESAMLEYASKNDDFTHMMLIQATSPLIEAKHLDEAVDLYCRSQADSLIALVKKVNFVWEKKKNGTFVPHNYDPLNRPRRQDMDGLLIEAGAFYITTREGLFSSKCRVNGRIAGYELPEECALDIDTMFDWEIGDIILENRENHKK